MTPHELEQNLHCFSGTTAYYALYPQLKLTDGTKYLCDQAQCYWLMDIIWSYQTLPQVRSVPFQKYILTVDMAKKKALVRCLDADEQELHRQFIGWTDFPLETVTVYYIDNIALLPSEY